MVDVLNLVSFGEFEPVELPGEAKDYKAMLHGLIKAVARHAGTVHWEATQDEVFHTKLAIAEWTRGVWDTEPGHLVLNDIESNLKINRVASSLEHLWEWHDNLPSN